MKLPQTPPPMDAGAFTAMWADKDKVARVRGHLAEMGLSYPSWEDLKYLPAPEGISARQIWWFVKAQRQSQYRRLPIVDRNDVPFVYDLPLTLQAKLHEVTRRAGGILGSPQQVDERDRHRYLVRNLMEEGITSSLIEGASTTRQQAREMIKSQRKPRTAGELMVYNNYKAMQYIIEQKDKPLTAPVILELHRILTTGTLESLDGAGRLRRVDEVIDVIDARDDEVLHVPPRAEELPARLERLCALANGTTPEEFLDPVVRAIALHFQLAYDHPFVDGNGRCARALFYWSMLRQGYWLCQFFSISEIILRAPAKYAQAFLLTETDENDLAYFIDHQLDVTIKALNELHAHMERQIAKRAKSLGSAALRVNLNDRQRELLDHALRHPDARYTFRSHQALNGVVYQTARTDLLELAELGLLDKRVSGKSFYFLPVENLMERLEKMSKAQRHTL